MQFEIKKATKYDAKLRLALIGISGSGKTYSALELAKHLGKKVCLVDTEFKSAQKYADKFDFDTIELDTFSPLTYVEVIKQVELNNYDVLIIDSLSHAWMGKEGALEQVDKAAKRSQSNNTYVAWRDVTPMHNNLVEAMLRCKCHLIVTMRAKQDYVLETNEKGKTVPRKVGLAPIQREGLEYEFDVVGDMDLDNNYIITKTRCSDLHNSVVNKPGKQLADSLKKWLKGEKVPVETDKKTEPAPDESTSTDKYEKLFKDKNPDEIKKLYNALPAAEKGKGSIAQKMAVFYADQFKKNDSPEIKSPARLIAKVNSKTTAKQLEMIDMLIEQAPSEDKANLVQDFQSKITEAGLTYEIQSLPF